MEPFVRDRKQNAPWSLPHGLILGPVNIANWNNQTISPLYIIIMR